MEWVSDGGHHTRINDGVFLVVLEPSTGEVGQSPPSFVDKEVADREIPVVRHELVVTGAKPENRITRPRIEEQSRRESDLPIVDCCCSRILSDLLEERQVLRCPEPDRSSDERHSFLAVLVVHASKCINWSAECAFSTNCDAKCRGGRLD